MFLKNSERSEAYSNVLGCSEDCLRSSHLFESFLKVLKRSLIIWGLLRRPEAFSYFLGSSERYQKLLSHSLMFLVF